MECIKCGKKTTGTSVFCEDCLSTMADYPVKPGTAVYLPNRTEPAEPKPALIRPTKEKSPEEQLTRLRKLLRVLLICLVTVTVALAISLGAICNLLTETTEPEAEPLVLPSRRNYTTTAPLEEE